jgi:type I restriction enzyme M protein
VLDSDTKKKIDSLRNILVGKIPNPQSQVEQITTGLIYKFMHDMDQESIEMGGEGSFFVGNYEKYSWNNLFDTKLSGVDKVKLYSDAIEGMYLNPSAPELFRNIFKNAFLPFKDPSTLNMFLKEVNEFHYSHSEKLGDAFEYLISIMDSQGDAGQFRTPRHIIDFIVEIINPQKHETVLDPACGTGGFLISSYKHILKTNTDKKLGDLLSASDRKKVGENIGGYDISPEMIKLSLVNMYLHGFSTPDIEEYDTLSSEDNWNKYYDVILANPPFFSPSGGIQPHKRFGVESKKAEVLFTSYILEHLKPNGRAGIIVPEGMIFQVGKAYKELRKQLIENALIGVISLPAGVFQPYSGVKTSILILDKKLNKERDSIFFADVKNDGFSLGAQRTQIKENDLPIVLENFKDFTNGIDADHISIQKEIINESGDYSLNLSKFQKAEVSSNFQVVKLSDVIELLNTKRKPIKKSNRVEGDFPYYGATGIIDYVNDYIFDEKLILVGEDGAKWDEGDNSAFIAEGKYWVNNHAHVIRPLRDKVLDFYLVQVLNRMDLLPFITGVTVPKLNQANLLSIQIPLPPIEVQQGIVNELEGYQKIIDGSKQVIENYKPTIDIDPSWEMVELGEITNISTGKLNANAAIENGEHPFFTCSKEISKINEYAYDQECILLSGNNAVGNFDVKYYKGKFNAYQRVYIISLNEESNDKVDYQILYYAINQSLNILKSLSVGSMTRYLTLPVVESIQIPMPSMDIQKEIVQKIEEERKVIEGNKKLIEIYTQKIQNRINKVWGEESG